MHFRPRQLFFADFIFLNLPLSITPFNLLLEKKIVIFYVNIFRALIYLLDRSVHISNICLLNDSRVSCLNPMSPLPVLNMQGAKRKGRVRYKVQPYERHMAHFRQNKLSVNLYFPWIKLPAVCKCSRVYISTSFRVALDTESCSTRLTKVAKPLRIKQSRRVEQVAKISGVD